MCGISGILDPSRSIQGDKSLSYVRRMTKMLIHRGPDNCGEWVDQRVGITLGHNRLAIVDLSAEGHQPMHSACERYVMVFNGEVYNYTDIRKELEGLGEAPEWRGHSDSEVLLAAFSCWGAKEAIKRINGMFALALWDREESCLYLVRDRMGEKPLYYGWNGKQFLFASELKALRANPEFHFEVDRNALALYARYGYIPAPYSIYKGIYKLDPGTILRINNDSSPYSPLKTHSYWTVRDVAVAGLSDPYSGSESDAVMELDQLLRNSIADKMKADVPVGGFLSGGIDSSTIVALMQAQSSQTIKTFSIGFLEDNFNEATYAKAVARHLGTDHTELYVSPEDAMKVIPALPTLYDEPFSDPSQIPTYLVSHLAKNQVSVCLSGDAGDELFGGYDRYFWCKKAWNSFRWIPLPMRRLMASSLNAITPDEPHYTAGGGNAQSRLMRKARTLANILATPSSEALYQRMISYWHSPESPVLGTKREASDNPNSVSNSEISDIYQQMMYKDLITYLPDDILVKVDRAAMAVSLETRVPLLDHRIVEFAWRLPLKMKIRHGQGKWLLRQLLYQYVPRELLERPKMGFGVPIGAWLRGPLREWAEALLDEGRLRSEGYFDPKPIRKKWMEHTAGHADWQFQLWSILMFQSWLATA